MLRIALAGAAENDLDAITEYTLKTWGTDQASDYLNQIEDGITLLAKSPGMGRGADDLHTGLRRFEVAHHVIFYTTDSNRLFVVRILHKQMLPGNYI